MMNPQYVLLVPWTVMDSLSCIVLFLASLFGWWMRRQTLAPDIFGFVSSLTGENPHFDLETGDGCILSGLERGRLLDNVKIKIGGVANKTEAVGRIGLSHIAEGCEAGGLKKKGKYG